MWPQSLAPKVPKAAMAAEVFNGVGTVAVNADRRVESFMLQSRALSGRMAPSKFAPRYPISR